MSARIYLLASYCLVLIVAITLVLITSDEQQVNSEYQANLQEASDNLPQDSNTIDESNVAPTKTIDSKQPPLDNPKKSGSSNQSVLEKSANSNLSISISTKSNQADTINNDSEKPKNHIEQNIQVNGQNIELDEKGRANETIKDDDSKVKIRIRDKSDNSGSSSLNISVDGESN